MTKNTLFIVGLFTIAIIGILFFAKSVLNNKQINNAPVSNTTSQAEWNIYTNSTYQYEIRYPSIGSVGKMLEEDRASDTKSAFVAVSWQDNKQGSIAILVMPTTQGSQSTERQQSLSLAPEKFAEYGRQTEMDYLSKNKTTYNEKLHLSELISAVVGGQPAYGFRINGYSEAWPLGGFEGPLLNVTNTYLVFENHTGDKFIIAYPANDPVAQKIVDSFQFTNGSTTVSTQN